MNKEAPTYNRTWTGAAYIAAFILMVMLLGRLALYFKTGADQPYGSWYADSYSGHQPVVNWEAPENIRGMYPDTFQRLSIQQAYTDAWHAANLCWSEGITASLSEYFADSMSAALLDAVGHHPGRAVRADLSHRIEPSLFTYNNQLITFKDKDVEMITTFHDAAGNITDLTHSLADFEVTMTLDDGRWRIRHIKQTAAGPWTAEPVDSSIGKFRIPEGSTDKNDDVPDIRGMNYYPAASPWLLFWDDFHIDTIQADLDLMRALGINTIRFFVPFAEFGGGAVDPLRIEQLGTFLDMAYQNGFMTVPTLFDFPKGFAIANYPECNSYLRTILTRFGGHPSILAWDLKNEPDRDFEAHGKTEVMHWLSFMLDKARIYAPGSWWTIGWSTPETAALLHEHLDIVSFHYYRKPSGLQGVIDMLSSEVAGKPLFLQEAGMSTGGIWPARGSEARQAVYLQEVIAIADENDLPYALWTLHDFRVAPVEVFGRKPWIRHAQKKFGIFRPGGRAKKSREVFGDPRDTKLD